jgi:hypothetical protein
MLHILRVLLQALQYLSQLERVAVLVLQETHLQLAHLVQAELFLKRAVQRVVVHQVEQVVQGEVLELAVQMERVVFLLLEVLGLL